MVTGTNSQNRLPRALSIREAAAETGLTYCFLRGLCVSGAVACFRAGRTKWLINADSLAEYMNGGPEAARE